MISVHSPVSQVFGGDSDDEEEEESQETASTKKAGKTFGDMEDDFDFIVDDLGQPIRRKKEDGSYTEP